MFKTPSMNIDESGNGNELRKLVTIKSTGIVDGKTKTYTYEMKMGTLEVPDSLNYTLSTVKPERHPLQSDGNIYLHGGVEVYGDIKVGQYLFTFDHGVGLPIVNEGEPAEAHWRRTTLPLFIAIRKQEESEYRFRGKCVYVQIELK